MNMHNTNRVYWFIGGLLAMVLALTLLPTTITPSYATDLLRITPEPEPAPGGGRGGGSGGGEPFVAAAVVPSPSISVVPGSNFAYIIFVRNLGDGGAGMVEVTMPFDPSQISIVEVQFDDEEAAVREITTDSLIFTIEDIDDESMVTATVFVALNGGVAPGTPLGARLALTGSGVQEETDESNLPVLVVGEGNVDVPVFGMGVEPFSGPAGSTHTFVSDVYYPNEPVTLWIHTAGGADVPVGIVDANEEGVVAANLTTTGLPAGTHALVGNGNWSFIQASGSFRVE